MNPFELIARKQLVGAEDTSQIELIVLLHFDAAKRGQCTNPGYNFISRHLIMANYLAVRLKSKSFQTITNCAGEAWRKAGERPTAALDLTTKEYRAVRAALGVYFRHLPRVEVGMYMEANKVAERLMQAA